MLKSCKITKNELFLCNFASNYNLSINKLTTKTVDMPQKNITLYSILLLLLFGCNTNYNKSIHKFPVDNKYDSEFPSKSVSNELSYISKTVKKIDILAFYATYYFPADSNITRKSINDSILKAYSNSIIITHESVSGTASVIYNTQELIGLLTCAHVIDFKDSIFSYYQNESDQIQTISIKIKQQNHVSGLPSGNSLEVAAINTEKDVALLMQKVNPESDSYTENVKTINYPLGSTKDLQWGSIVYIMGYPRGNLMVTRAIVSITDKMKTGMFVTDALYNHGISGGPVFAVRDGVPNFELVGMASSTSAEENITLIPEEDIAVKNNINAPYRGDIFIDNNKLISYGITYSVTIDEIVTFISSNEESLVAQGFDINSFFK